MSNDIYDPAYVKQVFDNCGRAYRTWSAFASLGFIWRWRRKCVRDLPKTDLTGAQGVDLMAGTGELWPHLLRAHPGIAKITAIDISHTMHLEAVERLHKSRSEKIAHLEINALESNLPEEAADFVVSSFGLKTFNPAQQKILAYEIARILKPGAPFALIEASDPKGWILRPLFRFYMDRVLPLIERFFMKGAQDFAMVGIYSRDFGDSRHFADCLCEAGLDVTMTRDFFGCATGVAGRKPM
ncbi:class I SAM-dependent methyltransferase [Halocynthiibacter sp.]|uniref:class I SAM-dependent methyltransferase n=1 Tax=Halocynthiibacter sp. TaxID=1979210 RepID=UPI003C3C9521